MRLKSLFDYTAIMYGNMPEIIGPYEKPPVDNIKTTGNFDGLSTNPTKRRKRKFIGNHKRSKKRRK